MRRGYIVTNKLDGATVCGAVGEVESLQPWAQKFDRAIYDVTEVPAEEYETNYAGVVHRVKRAADGSLHKRDKTYDEFRIYPPLGQQLDALWHAMDKGEIPKAKDFYDAIKQVKTKHPKP